MVLVLKVGSLITTAAEAGLEKLNAANAVTSKERTEKRGKQEKFTEDFVFCKALKVKDKIKTPPNQAWRGGCAYN